MNTPAIDAAASAPRSAAQRPAAPGPRPETPADAGAENLRRHATLARTLADLLLANVQNTASLNFNAARALLANAGLPPPDAADPRGESWRWAWRSFEVCATSADQILELTRGHVERTTGALWRGTEQLLEEFEATGSARSAALFSTFEALHLAQIEYWRAATQAHNALVTLARAGDVSTEQDHGPH